MSLFAKSFLCLILTACVAGLVLAEPDEATAETAWAVKPYSVGEGLTVMRVHQCGPDALLNAKDAEGKRSLWRATGETTTQVKYPDGSPVVGDWIDFALTGGYIQSESLLIVESKQDDNYAYGLLVGDTVTRFVDTEGAPTSGRKWFSHTGDTIIVSPRTEAGSSTSPMSVLLGNVLKPITDAQGNALECERCVVDLQPDGRRLLHAVTFEAEKLSEHRKFWLEGALVVPVPELKLPTDWGDEAEDIRCIYFKSWTLVVANGKKSSAAWNLIEGKFEPIVDGEGKPLVHQKMTPELSGDACYLFASDPTDDDTHPTKGAVYMLSGNKAAQLKTPEQFYLGAPHKLDWRGPPVVLVNVSENRDTYWYLDGDKFEPILTPDGEIMRAPGILHFWYTASHSLLRVRTDKGRFWAELDGSSVTLACPADNESWPRYSPFHEVDGELFYVSGLHKKQSVSIVKDGAAEILTFNDGKPLKGSFITSAQAGNKLYLCVIDDDDNYQGYVVERKK